MVTGLGMHNGTSDLRTHAACLSDQQIVEDPEGVQIQSTCDWALDVQRLDRGLALKAA